MLAVILMLVFIEKICVGYVFRTKTRENIEFVQVLY